LPVPFPDSTTAGCRSSRGSLHDKHDVGRSLRRRQGRMVGSPGMIIEIRSSPAPAPATAAHRTGDTDPQQPDHLPGFFSPRRCALLPAPRIELHNRPVGRIGDKNPPVHGSVTIPAVFPVLKTALRSAAPGPISPLSTGRRLHGRLVIVVICSASATSRSPVRDRRPAPSVDSTRSPPPPTAGRRVEPVDPPSALPQQQVFPAVRCHVGIILEITSSA